LDVYLGPDGVLTGSSRVSLEARERAAAAAALHDSERKQRDRERKREALEARIVAMRKEFEIEDAETTLIASQEVNRKERLSEDRRAMARSRHADEDPSPRTTRKRGSR